MENLKQIMKRRNFEIEQHIFDGIKYVKRKMEYYHLSNICIYNTWGILVCLYVYKDIILSLMGILGKAYK